jgi:magnesium transporter
MEAKIMESFSPNARQILVQGFFRLYPGEAAGHLNRLQPDETLRLLQAEPAPISAKVLLRLNPDVAARLIKPMSDELFRRLFISIDPVRGAIILARLDENAVQQRLAMLPETLAKEYSELMSYPPDSAGHLMDPRVASFSPNDTIEYVLERIRAIGDRRIIDICLVDEEGALVAVVPLQDIAIAQPRQRLSELVHREPITVNMMDPREDIVQLLEDRKLTSLPVVSLDRKLLGIIRYDALVAAAQREASQDLQSMFGAGKDERALSRVSFAVRKRLPWLEINLATAFLAATVVGLFEDTIAKMTALAVFLPVVAGQSGNTGSQALAVTMRGLALREIRTRHWFRVARKEVSVGFINGVVIAISTSLVVYIWMSSMGLAVVIGSSMVFSMVIAGLSGAVIPMILKAFGQDPAQSSSIILTTVTDVVGFMSFLGLATLLAGILNIS